MTKHGSRDDKEDQAKYCYSMKVKVESDMCSFYSSSVSLLKF